MRQVRPRARARTPLSLLLSCCLALLAVHPPALSAAAADDAAPGESTSAANPSAAAAPAAQADASVVGQWGALSADWPTVPIHLSLLPNGKLLFWGRDKLNGNDVVGSTKAFVWSPNYSTANLYDGPFTAVTNTTTNLFCSGHSFLPDGRLLVTGGHGHANFDGIGITHTNIFNYNNNTWTRGPDMNRGRWYPFNVTLASGETLVVSGRWWDGTFVGGAPRLQTNNVPQVYTAAGTLQTLNAINQVEQPLYPWLHLMQDGRVFLSGYAQQSYYLNVAAQQWQLGPLSSQLGRGTGSGVMYDVGKVLIMGGGDPPSSAGVSEAIDLTQPSPFFRAAGQMIFPRRQMTAVLLPTGNVMVFGGTSSGGFNDAAGAIHQPEQWDRATETWAAMAATPSGTPRLYHSTAVLLPDARVLVAGGGLPAAANQNTQGQPGGLFGYKKVEIFSPPYLFRAGGLASVRPVITTAPTNVTYGQTFNVGMGPSVSALNIRKVTLVRLPSMTHSFNQDQRINYLTYMPRMDGASLDVTAPTDRRHCPPGHYMMFIINAKGTPSVAKIIKIS